MSENNKDQYQLHLYWGNCLKQMSLFHTTWTHHFFLVSVQQTPSSKIIRRNHGWGFLPCFCNSQVIIMKKTFFTVQKYQLKSTDNLLGSDASTSRWQCAIISSSSWDSASASDTSGCEDVPLCSVAWWWAVLECNCIFGGLKYMSCFLTWSKWRSAVGFCHHSQMLVLVLVN